MNVPASLAALAGTPDSRFFRAVQEASRRISWRIVGVTVAIMIALDAWLVIEIFLANPNRSRTFSTEQYLSGATINLFMSFSIMFMTLVADELVERGARRFRAYALAVVIGSAAAALAQWGVHRWLRLPSSFLYVDPYQATFVQPTTVFLEYLIWGAIFVYIYVNRRSALRAAARLSSAHVRRAEAQRRTLESRLQAFQARVEPQFLFDTLARVRDLYEGDPAKGGEMLDELILYLRAALPQLRESTSTLEQELKLVGAYLAIMRLHGHPQLGLEVTVSEKELTARMPPMVLLPLIGRLVSTGCTEPCLEMIRVVSSSTADALRVEVSDGHPCGIAKIPRESLRDIEERLDALYGDRGRLGFESSSSGTRIVIEIQYESSDGGCR